MSLYFAAEAATVLQWTRLSDHIGRKPVLLSCLLGTIVASVLFGLSRSFWALVFRCVSNPGESIVRSNWVCLAVVCVVCLVGTWV